MAAAVGKPRRHKYGVDQSAAGKAARTIQHNGKDVLCGSAAEARRFAQLVQLERAALIDGLVPHPRYPLKAHFPNGSGITVAVYVADSSYYERRTCKSVVEDVKGKATAEFKLKAKWFRACYPGLDFRVIPA